MVNHRGPEFKALLGRVSSSGCRRRSGPRTTCCITDCVGHRRPGGRGRQPPVAGRPGAVRQHRRLRRPASRPSPRRYGADVDQARRASGAGPPQPDQVRADHLRALAEAADARQGRAGDPQRDVDRRHQPARGARGRRSTATAPDALIIVDGVSGIGALPFETDGWGIDVVVTGSQKSWMVPPGLAMVARLAARLGRRRRPPRCPASTSTSSARPRRRGQGRDALDARGRHLLRARRRARAHRGGGLRRPSSPATRCGAAATRAGLAAMGFRLFADPAHASNTVTSAHLPEGVEWSALSKALRGAGPRPRRRPGQADRQDLPHRPPGRRRTWTTSCAPSRRWRPAPSRWASRSSRGSASPPHGWPPLAGARAGARGRRRPA